MDSAAPLTVGEASSMDDAAWTAMAEALRPRLDPDGSWSASGLTPLEVLGACAWQSQAGWRCFVGSFCRLPAHAALCPCPDAGGWCDVEFQKKEVVEYPRVRAVRCNGIVSA